MPEKQLLNLRLKFCPTPPHPDRAENEEAIRQLIRKIHLKAYFRNHKVDETTCDTPWKKLLKKYQVSSTWTPPISDIPKNVISFTNDLSQKLRDAHESKHKPQNLTHRQKIGLRRIKKDIVIKPVDKGSRICVLSI